MDAQQNGSSRLIVYANEISMSLQRADREFRVAHSELRRGHKPSEALELSPHMRSSVPVEDQGEILWIERKDQDSKGDVEWIPRLFLHTGSSSTWKGIEFVPRPYAMFKLEAMFRAADGAPLSAQIRASGDEEVEVMFEDLHEKEIRGPIRTWFGLVGTLERFSSNPAVARVPAQTQNATESLLQDHGVTIKS
jgi:hypothetical protein